MVKKASAVQYRNGMALISDLPGPQNNKNAWPFVEPVDPEEVPSYYKVIKEPMGEWAGHSSPRRRREGTQQLGTLWNLGAGMFLTD